jgi:diaminohydroxyphosphoribosylaminopyrimidine deaminase/5-amino-6-(5-phosphoribosylamino)uracil reductase
MKAGTVQHGDEKWMRQALALARQGCGLTRPNPPVGAVVVSNGKRVGKGFHRKAGGPHAEVYALRQAGARAQGATLYVTLEPCSTQGRTGPCTELILQSRVRRVVVAMQDPNPRHAGRGFKILRAAGIEVVQGVCEAEARPLLAPFAKRMLFGMPWVTLKLGMTLDGRIADCRGRSKWITGEPARGLVQQWRREADAILVGAETLRADDPQLTCRLRKQQTAWRVVVTQSGKVPAKARLFRDADAAKTIVATSAKAAPRVRKALGDSLAAVWALPGRKDGLDLRVLLERLAECNVMQVLCEGGGGLAASLLESGLADELRLFLAPKLLGGDGVPGFGARRWTLDGAPELTITGSRMVGADMLVEAVPKA